MILFSGNIRINTSVNNLYDFLASHTNFDLLNMPYNNMEIQFKNSENENNDKVKEGHIYELKLNYKELVFDIDAITKKAIENRLLVYQYLYKRIYNNNDNEYLPQNSKTIIKLNKNPQELHYIFNELNQHTSSFTLQYKVGGKLNFIQKIIRKISFRFSKSRKEFWDLIRHIKTEVENIRE